MEQKKDFIINFIYYGIMIALVFFSFKYIAPVMVPFIIGFSIAFLLRKPIKKIETKLHLNHKFTAVVVLILFYVIVGTICGFAIAGTINFFKNFADQLPTIYTDTIEPFLNEGYEAILKALEDMSFEDRQSILQLVTESYEYLKQLLSSLTNVIVGFATHLVTAVPKLFMSTIIMLISSFFFVLDYETIIAFINRNLIKKYTICKEIQTFVKEKLLVIGRSYLIIITLTFTELVIALNIFSVDNVVIIAACIALFDILPIFGTGGIMIPWGLIALVGGNYFLGIGLLVTYIIMTVIRQIVEPKLVGTSLGLHPIATLMLMLIGMRFFGFVGMLGLPIFASFLLFKYHKNHQEEITMA